MQSGSVQSFSAAAVRSVSLESNSFVLEEEEGEKEEGGEEGRGRGGRGGRGRGGGRGREGGRR